MKKLFLAATLIVSAKSFALDCFNADFVNGWNYENRSETLKVQSFRDEFDVKVTPFCHELSFANTIGFRSFGGGSFICAGDDVVVLDGFNRPIETCRIESIKKVK